jgi:large subunit ribosomal protein L27Ae
VNLDKLWTLVPDEVREKFLGKKTDTAPIIDTLALVYLPLLSSS